MTKKISPARCRIQAQKSVRKCARTSPRVAERKRARGADKELGGVAGARLHDGGAEEAGRLRRDEVPADAEGARRLAIDGHARGVAAERANVGRHPLE